MKYIKFLSLIHQNINVITLNVKLILHAVLVYKTYINLVSICFHKTCISEGSLLTWFLSDLPLIQRKHSLTESYSACDAISMQFQKKQVKKNGNIFCSRVIS